MATRKIMIDGISVEIEERDAQVVERRLSASLTADLATAKTALATAQTTAQNDVATARTETANATTLANNKDAEIATLKSQLADAKMSPEKLDKMVTDRVATVAARQGAASTASRVDGKSDAEIRRQVVSAKLGDTAKDWSDDMVTASFNTLSVGAGRQRQRSAARRRSIVHSDNRRATGRRHTSSTTTARQPLEERRRSRSANASARLAGQRVASTGVSTMADVRTIPRSGFEGRKTQSELIARNAKELTCNALRVPQTTFPEQMAAGHPGMVNRMVDYNAVTRSAEVDGNRIAACRAVSQSTTSDIGASLAAPSSAFSASPSSIRPTWFRSAPQCRMTYPRYINVGVLTKGEIFATATVRDRWRATRCISARRMACSPTPAASGPVVGARWKYARPANELNVISAGHPALTRPLTISEIPPTVKEAEMNHQYVYERRATGRATTSWSTRPAAIEVDGGQDAVSRRAVSGPCSGGHRRPEMSG